MNEAGKGDSRRPTQITREEENLRYAYALGKMTFEQYEKRFNELLRQGKIVRNGRVCRPSNWRKHNE